MDRSLTEGLAVTKSEIDAISAGLENDIRTIQAGAAQAIVDLVGSTATGKPSCSSTVTPQAALAGGLGTTAGRTGSHTDIPSRGEANGAHGERSDGRTGDHEKVVKATAVEAMLALVRGPLRANEVDRAVMRTA